MTQQWLEGKLSGVQQVKDKILMGGVLNKQQLRGMKMYKQDFQTVSMSR
jgi:hypothetical protein